MVKRHLGSALTVVVTLGVMAGGLFAVGQWRKAGDATWCRQAVMGGTVSDDPALKAPELVAQQRSACAQQRQRQRMLFGAFWRKGGTTMAECGFQLARVQTLDTHADARHALAAQYGIDDPEFDGVGLEAQDRFIKACLAKARHQEG